MSAPNWQRIAAHYSRHQAAILAAGRNEWGIDPYAWDHEAGIRLTPIEQGLWHDIRAEDLVLYPQYPVAGHFVDFGNPVARVAIECDGRAYHQDQQRDAVRQRRIEAAGWTVFRIGGADCLKDFDEIEDDNGVLVITATVPRLLVRDIAAGFGIARR